MTTSPAATHPLVVAYLADLDRVLVGTDPQERADTLAAIREHIADALGGAEQDTATTMAVLADLGPVERIAATATPAGATASGATASTPTKDWVAPALLGCALVSFALIIALPWVATPLAVGTLVMAVIQLRRGTGREGFLRTTVVLSIATLLVSALLMAFLLATGSPEPVPGDVETVQSSAE